MPMLEQREKAPMISIWFGNFFEPAFSSKEFVKEGIARLHRLGFNSIQLDSKAWQDFFDRYEGREASDYVAMQEYMMDCIREEGLSHSFLALYLNGDNLYPKIRYSPPVFGESVVNADGTDGHWYKYWSERAQQSMIEHLRGLYRCYGKNALCVETGGEKRLPVCTMWDPITAPSFDEDGKQRVRAWLAQRYGTIDAWNRAYGEQELSFAELQPEQYWFGLDGTELPSRQDYEQKTPAYFRYTDNLRYCADELVNFFQRMQEKIRKENPLLACTPILSQWDIFLNIAPRPEFQRISDLWDTTRRGIDPYRIAPYVDNCTFITVPCMPNGDPSAYASSCQNSMMRCMNFGREFTVGFYLGRYLYNDIYTALTPAEIIGTAVASGASGYYSYGYGGLDDGGVMHKLGRAFQDSIQIGNSWAKRVIPNIQGKRKKQVALLYPAQMALTEPYFVEGNEERRIDLLGYYQAVCDCGLQADVLHPDQVADGLLDGYLVLVLPTDSQWDAEQNPALEQAIRDFAEQGGVVFSGANHPVQALFGITSDPHPCECVRYQEGLIPMGSRFTSFRSGDVLAHFEDSQKPAIVRHQVGKGTVYSFGLLYGAEYLKKETAAVPEQYGNRDFYPICVAEHDPFQELLKEILPGAFPSEKGIEIAEFEDSVVVVNHTSYPWDASSIQGEKDFQISAGQELLLPHSAVYVKRNEHV